MRLPESTHLNTNLESQADDLAKRFRERDPFRHVVIENFFAEDCCAQ